MIIPEKKHHPVSISLLAILTGIISSPAVSAPIPKAVSSHCEQLYPDQETEHYKACAVYDGAMVKRLLAGD